MHPRPVALFTFLVLALAAASAKAGPPVEFGTAATSCMDGGGGNYTTGPVGQARESYVVRLAASGTGFGQWAPLDIGGSDTAWMFGGSVAAGSSLEGAVFCNPGAAFSSSLTFFDTPATPTSFLGATTFMSTWSRSYLGFRAPGTAQYVAELTLHQGAVRLIGGSFEQSFASSGSYQLGTLQAGLREVEVRALEGPQAIWTVSIRALPVAIGGLTFGRPFARPADILTADYTTSGDTAVSATIMSSAGVPVRQLATGLPVGPGNHTLTWDGFDEAGAPLGDGAYMLSLRSSDPSGLGGTAQTYVTLDGTPPAVAMVSNRKLPAQNAFVARASDSTSGLARATLRIDGRQVTSGARLSYRPKKGWRQGRHGWSLVAVDGAGNRREAGGSFTITPGNLTRSCRTVVITPRSGNALYGIKAKGLFCNRARKTLLAWGRAHYRPRRGPRGYRCHTVRRYRAGNGRLSCRSGKKVISFNTGL
jgi:FlgD Ig-like domain